MSLLLISTHYFFLLLCDDISDSLKLIICTEIFHDCKNKMK